MTRVSLPRAVLLLLGVVMLAGCNMEDTWRTDKPLSRAEASKKVPFPLPASATDVYFAAHVDGMQEFEEFVRFTVDPGEIDSTVRALLAKRGTSQLVYSPDAETRFLPMPWWTPNSISHGDHRVSDSPPIYLWTDTDNHVIFVYTSG